MILLTVIIFFVAMFIFLTLVQYLPDDNPIKTFFFGVSLPGSSTEEDFINDTTLT